MRNVPADAAWTALETDPAAMLCDVRTEAEWRQVGVPDLGGLNKQTVFLSWSVPPAMQPNPRFLEELEAAGIGKDSPVFFICRSGQRSQAAALAAEAAGWRHVFNVAEGFEGRGPSMPGWAAQGLPVATGT
jgi:rhodanese-related sulfurtransferase